MYMHYTYKTLLNEASCKSGSLFERKMLLMAYIYFLYIRCSCIFGAFTHAVSILKL